MKRLLLLFCLAMSMLTQTSAQGNNPYVLHIYNGRILSAPQADFLAATYLNGKFDLTTVDNGLGPVPVYSRNGKKLFMGNIPNIFDIVMQQVVILNATVADNFGFSFTEKEISTLASTALAGYTGIVVDFSKDNLAINADNFPDQNFRVFLQSESYGKDYVLTPEEISVIKSLYLINNGITSLKGIEYFTALTELFCYGNQLTSLDLSKNTALTRLVCLENQLTSLDVSKNTALEYLDCSINQLTSLDVSKNTALTSLYCGLNELTSLDVSKNTALTELDCYENQLTSLDVSKNTALEYLKCSTNLLTSLDVSKNTALEYLDCSTNLLTSLDVSKNTALTSLYCGLNELTSLDLSKNTALEFLYCSYNQLTSLDVSQNTELGIIYCEVNQIKGAQAENFVNSLPTVTFGELYFCDLTNAAEKNEITDAQVAKAKAKGWTVYAWNGSDWEEYAGITGIGNVEQAEPGAVRTYTLDGRPVSGQPAKPGIYIRGGKKVIVK